MGACMACGMEDPPPTMTCTKGAAILVDHYVGLDAGCSGCGRLPEACAVLPCDARLAVILRQADAAGQPRPELPPGSLSSLLRGD